MPGSPSYGDDIVKPTPETLTSILDKIHDTVAPYSPGSLAKAALGAWGDSIATEGRAGGQDIGSGINDIMANKPASGLASIAGGLTRQVGALSGVSALSSGIDSAVTNMTGNPDAGKRAAFLTSFALTKKAPDVAPTGGNPALTPGFNPSVIGRPIVPAPNAAINQLVADIGPENVPAAIQKVQNSGGRLALMDVADPVRTTVQGLVDPAQPEAMRMIVSNVKDRMATQPGAVNSAYTTAMGPNPDVV